MSKKIKKLKNKIREQKDIQKMKNNKSSSEKNKLENKLIKKNNRKPKGNGDLKNTTNNIIDVINVNKTYVSGSIQNVALKNVDLQIKKGSFVVILGESGSGKTTLLNILSGLDRATQGDVIVSNINISTLSNKSLTTFRRNYVGFVFQSYNLLLELNAYDNAKMGRRLQMDGNKRLDIKELFEKVGIGDKLNSSITDLSGGQLQRVSLVRALSKNPKIIFADEPTGALDSESSKKVLKLFKEINAKYKTTIILVTHDEKIADMADIIVNVKDGKVKTTYV